MLRFLILVSGLFFYGLICAADVASVPAMPKIMVVDFILRDVSPLPDAPQEIERVALLDTVIKQTLAAHGYVLLKPCDELLKASKQAISYLFDRPELAASLGGACGADYVLMGESWKPSYLFSFPQIKLMDTRKGLKSESPLVLVTKVQMEASTLDKDVTVAAARKLALLVIDKLNALKK
ncbi:MAG: DUF2380 domain-containing protein [Methylophilaceae bacterium]|nr:DUF2380 domain-containing protein [Methylophilaceae bacterium]